LGSVRGVVEGVQSGMLPVSHHIEQAMNSPELNETLEELAERSHSSKSDVLRKAIALFDIAAQAKQKDQRVGILDRDDKVVKEIVGI
jgi:predicted transcriptional regulator